MGTTFSSINILSDEAIQISDFEFQSFSNGWQTCIAGFSDQDFNCACNEAKLISKRVACPVLHYFISDSDYIYFSFLQNGKCISQYSDYEFIKNKNIYGIPSLIGYEDGYKKRLSDILSCADANEKTEMLEEYFGVCLLPFSECLSNPSQLRREKSDTLYREFIKKAREITGKQAPISLKLVSEIKGKIYKDNFGSITQKEHCYLFGYETEESEELKPVRFVGEKFELISVEEFNKDRTSQINEDSVFNFDMEIMHGVIFNDRAPEPYRGKKMKLPSGMYPFAFDDKNRLLLSQQGKIAVVDENLEIIAKCSIKGQPADIVGDYILTTSGLSFCGYCYDPISTVRIYRFVEKK